MRRLSHDILFDSGHLKSDLGRKSVRGGLATMAAQGILFVLRLIGTIILARLLAPADYGLVGMVMVVINFAAMFKDAGLSMATVQKDHISHEQISTLFWLNVLISALLCLGVLISSPLVAWFYGQPELTAVTAVLSISFIISGLTIQHQALLRRHMEFALLATVQILSQIITLVVTTILACWGWRHWALVGGTLAQALAGTILIFYFCPWRPGRMRRRAGTRDMLSFGGHLMGFDFANYFARNADSVLIGKFIGADALGLYARAHQLFMFPITQIREPLTQVAAPVLSALQRQPERYIKYYQRFLDITASFTIPLALYCAIEADFLIRVLLGSQWIGAVPVFRMLAVAGMIQPSTGTMGLVLVSRGLSARYMKWGVFSALATVAAIFVGALFGIAGVALSIAVLSYAILPVALRYCFHGTPIRSSLFLRTLVLPTVVSAGAAVAAWGSSQGMQIVLGAGDSGAKDGFLSHLVLLAVFAALYGGASCFRRSVRETAGSLIPAAWGGPKPAVTSP